MAKGAVYAAPVVVTLSTPEGLLGQGQNTNSQKGGMGKQGNPCPPGQVRMGDVCVPVAATQAQSVPVVPQAPWQSPPPGTPPGGSGPPGGPP